MNINKFKEGDIITRTEPNQNPNGDRSFMNDRLEFVGIENGIIVLIGERFCDEIRAIKLSSDWWGDGWDYFPETLWQKAISKIKKVVVRENDYPAPKYKI